MKLQVKVKPNTKQQRIIEEENGSLTIYLKSPPVDGKANAELVKLLAKKYDVPKSCVKIESGLSSRIKRVAIAL